MALPALGQSPVTAEVDRNFLSTDDALILTVTVDTGAGDAARPELPVMNDFQILGSSSGTQISIVNGDMTVMETYNYSLRPLRAGSLVIGPIMVQINGQTCTTRSQSRSRSRRARGRCSRPPIPACPVSPRSRGGVFPHFQASPT